MHTTSNFKFDCKGVGKPIRFGCRTFLLSIMLLIGTFMELTAQEWFANHIAQGLNGSVMRPMSVGSYDLEANKTFVAFLGESSHIYAMVCDHNNNDTWSGPVKIADSPTSTSAKYAYPQLVQTPDGYIHVFFSKHTTNIWYARSSKPHDISSWDVRDITNEAAVGSSDFSKLKPAYPKVLLGRDGFIYLFWRQSTSVDYIRHASVTVSKTSGETWEPARFLITPIRDDLINETYVGQITVEPRRPGVPERFHFVYILAGGPEGHNQYHKNLYHAIWQPGNGHFYSLHGEDLGTVLDSPEMDSRDCLVYPTESAKTAIGYTHTVAANDKGEPIVDETWVYNGSEWVENSGGSQLDIDDSPAFLQWEDGRMLAYGDRFVLYESFDMGNNWNRIASVSAPTGNSGTPTRTIPITKPSHPSARVWIKEQNVSRSTNYLTIVGQTSSKQAEKIILKANYPSIPLGGRCTIQAFLTDLSNGKATGANNTVNFTIEGSGSLSQASAVAVNGMATVEFTADNTDEVVIIRASSSNIESDYLEVYVGNGLLENTEEPTPVECSVSIGSIQYSQSTGIASVNFSTTGQCSQVNASLTNQSGTVLASLSNVSTGFEFNIPELCSECLEGTYSVNLTSGTAETSSTFSYVPPRSLEILSYSPNPTYESVTITYFSPVQGNVDVTVQNSSGQQVLTSTDNAIIGEGNELVVDLSGEVEGSYTIALTSGGKVVTCSVNKLDVVPTYAFEILDQSESPIIDYFEVSYSSPSDTTVTAEVVNESDHVVLQKTEQATVGVNNKISFDFKNLPAGSYTVRLNNGNSTLTCNVMKQEITVDVKVVKNFPNPTTGLFAIEFICKQAMTVPITVYNDMDEVVLTQSYPAKNGKNKLVLKLNSLEAGIYRVELGGKSGTEILVTKE